MKVDLHIHSTYSDSSRSLEEIVDLAKERNVSLISICDHATIGAYDTFPRICSENNIIEYWLNTLPKESGEYLCPENYFVKFHR